MPRGHKESGYLPVFVSRILLGRRPSWIFIPFLWPSSGFEGFTVGGPRAGGEQVRPEDGGPGLALRAALAGAHLRDVKGSTHATDMKLQFQSQY
jgi:hypothetical protein